MWYRITEGQLATLSLLGGDADRIECGVVIANDAMEQAEQCVHESVCQECYSELDNAEPGCECVCHEFC